jgi:hypothetical protein
MRSVYEIKAHKELEAQMWDVDYKMRPSRPTRGYHTDYWNLFDLMAHRTGDPIRFISIKGKEGVPGKHRQAVKDFWMPENCQKEIWHYIENVKDRRTTKCIKEVIL